ncbi:MAG: hypothetical protein IPN79_15570 [Saprospiraceae bacterium]|nr:hypothetical protein [Saprospiraceae bacterium]
MYKNKKVAGLWIDHEVAQIISNEDNTTEGNFEAIRKIKSNIHGSFGSSQNANTHKLSGELHDFFKHVSHELTNLDYIYVFGPGKAQEEFRNYITKEGLLKSSVLELGTAEAHISHNQMIAKVRNHFIKE